MRRIDIAKTALLARLEAAGLVLERVEDALHGVYVLPDGAVTFAIGISVPADIIEATAAAARRVEVVCRGCGDTRSEPCGTDDCPVRLQQEGDL